MLMYLFTPIFVAALLPELRSIDPSDQSGLFVAGGLAIVVQANYLIWPVYRVLGPATFEEVLFTSEDLLVLGIAAVATVGFLSLRKSGSI